jgi:uncharacterized protein YicC (UPF0701 family)
MSTEIDEFRQSLVAAVQAELERHASAVVAEVDRLRDEGRRERAEIRAELTEQIRSLAQAVEQVQRNSEQHTDRARQALEQRLEESEARQTRRLGDATSGIDGLVEAAARPYLATVKDEQDALGRRVEHLDSNLRKFDEQAARMVTYFNDVSQQMEQRQDELGEALQTDVTSKIDTIQKLVEENDSAIRRFQNEVGQSVTQKINDAEDRFNNRLLATETRMKEESGQKIAEIDVHVSRVSSGLDETMTVLNDRIAGLDDRFVEVGRRIDGVEESVKGVDQEALDELKEKMSSAAGEAMLVRIEMERLEKGVTEKTDGLAVRLTEVETNLADTTLDVSTAVQLDRMEEIERALLELDPSKFVLKDESVKKADTSADEVFGAPTFDPPEAT